MAGAVPRTRTPPGRPEESPVSTLPSVCRPAAGLALALVLSLASGGPAQEPPKGAGLNAREAFVQMKERLAEGRYDLAALFLQAFVDSNPTDQQLLDIEADPRYGATAFRSLRTIPRWSDDPAVDKRARGNVEAVIARATAATERVLRDPARITRFVRNLGETVEERRYAEVELRRTGDFAVPFMVDTLRTTATPALAAGILDAIPKLDAPSAAAWLAAADGLSADQRYAVLTHLVARADAVALTNTAQTDYVPALWRLAGDPDATPTGRRFAREALEKLVRGADRKEPVAELVARARRFADRKARYLGATADPDQPAATAPVWVWDAAAEKLVKRENVPAGQADEYFGLRYARWALDLRPDDADAQGLVLALAADRAVERANFGDIARTDPAVYRLLADAPAAVLADQLDKALADKRTALAVALTRALGDRAEAAPPVAGTPKPSLYERALAYPDPRVQLAAANALLRSPTPVDPRLRVRIVDVLKRAAAASPDPGGKGRVLLADPDRRRADDTAARLRDLGYAVELFGTGRDLLRRAARAADYDLVMVDRHLPVPGLVDTVSQLRAARPAAVPVLVVASADRVPPPSFDQLLLRFALLIAATETEPAAIPAAFTPKLGAKEATEEADRAAAAARRDAAFRATARTRLDRLQRVLDTLGLGLTDDQKFQVGLRSQQITYAVLAAEFPVSAASAPATTREVADLNRQAAVQPNVPEYTRDVGISQLGTLVERLEVDVNRNRAAQEKYDTLRARTDTSAIALRVRSPRDEQAEIALGRQFRGYPGVRVIPEPLSRVGLELDLNAAFADPADRPRDPAEKAAGARLAVEWLGRMAAGTVPGFDATPAAPELLAALRSDDLAEPAIDGVARLGSAEAQQALLTLASTPARPLPLRAKAADAAVRHIRTNGPLAPKPVVDPLVALSRTEADPDMRGKLLVLKGMLARDPKEYAAGLRSYNPSLVPPAPKDTAPMPKDAPVDPKKEPDKID